jgi:hypothetical protein
MGELRGGLAEQDREDDDGEHHREAHARVDVVCARLDGGAYTGMLAHAITQSLAEHRALRPTILDRHRCFVHFCLPRLPRSSPAVVVARRRRRRRRSCRVDFSVRVNALGTVFCRSASFSGLCNVRRNETNLLAFHPLLRGYGAAPNRTPLSTLATSLVGGQVDQVASDFDRRDLIDLVRYSADLLFSRLNNAIYLARSTVDRRHRKFGGCSGTYSCASVPRTLRELT